MKLSTSFDVQNLGKIASQTYEDVVDDIEYEINYYNYEINFDSPEYRYPFNEDEIFYWVNQYILILASLYQDDIGSKYLAKSLFLEKLSSEIKDDEIVSIYASLITVSQTDIVKNNEFKILSDRIQRLFERHYPHYYSDNNIVDIMPLINSGKVIIKVDENTKPRFF